ncbi:Cell surface Cu-only superoxide dismutase [Exophiala dermatitidis]
MALFTVMLSLLFLAISVLAQNAPITQNNPKMATFQAVLQIDKPVQGQITGVSNGNGTGVNFNINFYAFPVEASAGPYKYHIHVNPVPSDGNCTGTGGHLTPYGRNDTPPCDASQPSTCQPGDLSGKHGSIELADLPKNFQVTYLDAYVSTDPNSPAFFGNRSIVVHAANGTRLNCGNFIQQQPSTNNNNATWTSCATPSGTATATGTATGTKSAGPTIASSTGAAMALEVPHGIWLGSVGGLVLAAAAMVLG